MIVSLGLTLADGRHECPGVLYDMVALHNQATQKNEKKEDEE